MNSDPKPLFPFSTGTWILWMEACLGSQCHQTRTCLGGCGLWGGAHKGCWLGFCARVPDLPRMTMAAASQGRASPTGTFWWWVGKGPREPMLSSLADMGLELRLKEL